MFNGRWRSEAALPHGQRATVTGPSRSGRRGTHALVWMITALDTDFTLTSGPAGPADAFRTQAARCLHAIQAT
jgi:hypothetical protein